MDDWTWRETIQDGYRRPKTGAPSLRDAGIYPTDIARPVVKNPNGTVSTERMQVDRMSDGLWHPYPTMGPPSLQQLRGFPTAGLLMNTCSDVTSHWVRSTVS